MSAAWGVDDSRVFTQSLGEVQIRSVYIHKAITISPISQLLGYNDEHYAYVPLRGTEWFLRIFSPQAALASLA